MTKTNWSKTEIKYRLARAGWPYLQDIDRRCGLPINTAANATHRPSHVANGSLQTYCKCPRT